MKTSAIDLLECTLRDGSYQVGFGFTAQDTAAIAASLDQAGFPEIEVAHGLGLGGGQQPGCAAAESDAGYIDAARQAVKRARLGVFAIPSMASPAMVTDAARRGVDYIRIGVEAGNPARAEELVKVCLDEGVDPYVFFMQSGLVGPDVLGENAAVAASFGAKTVYVVDSAGFMLPQDVTAYIQAVRSRADLRVGFHGHNNLQLVMANAIAAVEAGATLIDCTLRGLGRSSGNPQTEVLTLVLTRLGYKTGVDTAAAMQAADRFIAPLENAGGNESIDIALGYAGLHSRFVPKLSEIAEKQGMTTIDLLLAAGHFGKPTSRMEDLLDIAYQFSAKRRAHS
ncbi:MAG TPA: hypothetical protein VM639_07365 [Dongiaceae bacterium]|nr:hypothetical protein [Dongiaceae bacterium]